MKTIARSLLLLALLFVAACDSTELVRTPTQVLLHVTCDDSELLARTTSVKVLVSGYEKGTFRDVAPVEFDVDKFEWPLELPIFPRKGSDESRQFQVIVQAFERDRLLAETRALTRFARGKHKRLDRELYFCPGDPGRICAVSSCRGEACEVCSKRGMCEPVEVFTDLPEVTSERDGATESTDEDGGETSPVDAGTGSSDAGSAADAAVDAALGAGALDAGALDAGALDAGALDAGALDAGALDAGALMDAEAGSALDGGTDAGADAALSTCTTGTVRCGPDCVNLMNSALSCGRCGRTCRSNSCSAGACAATAIYTHTPAADAGTFVSTAALDQSFVYFQDPASVQVLRVSTAGGIAPTLVSYKTPGERINHLRIDNNYLYANVQLGGNDAITRMALASDDFTTIMGTDGLITIVVGMTTNTSQVFVVQTLSSNYIDAIPKTGASGYTRLASGPSLSSELEADDSHVYLRDSSAIMRTLAVPAGAPLAPTVVAAFENGESCRDVALTTDRVLYASSQRVAIVPKAGGTIGTLATLSAHSVIADADSAYFMHPLGDAACAAGSELYRVPLSGGAALRLAVEPASCRGGDCCGGPLMQDGAALYWLRGDGLAIRRVEK